MNQETYIRKTARKLSCNRDKRNEFIKQLASDIESALESGESWDAIQKRIGTPTEVAKEINESLGEGAVCYQKKKYRITGLVTGAVLITCAATLLLILYPRKEKAPEHTQNTSPPLASQTNEILPDEDVQSLSAEVIKQFSAGDYKAVLAGGDDRITKSLSADTLRQVREQIMPDAGKLLEIKKGHIIRINEENTSYVTVQTPVCYANQTVTFTLSWNSQKQLCGFYLK